MYIQYMCSDSYMYMYMYVSTVFGHFPFSELGATGSSSVLAGIIARNVDKTITLFNMKCEQAVREHVHVHVH